MERFAFILTIFFMLLGPIKLIPVFSGLMQDANPQFKRSVALKSVIIACVMCLFVILAGKLLVNKYEISLAALRITGGLILLISAMQVIFSKVPAVSPAPATAKAIQLAVSPVAVPSIVPPAGVAAILIAMMMAPQYPGIIQAVVICLVIVMVMNFLVLYFIDQVLKTPGLAIVLTILGSVLVFVQASLAIDTIINGLQDLGLVHLP